MAAATLAAQESPSDSSSGIGDSTRRVTALSEFFDHDFVNVYAFANGIWDSRVPELTNNVLNYGSGLGWEAGGGIALSHRFKGGDITLNYSGSYRDYQSQTFNGGVQQSLSLAVTKRLARHWSLGASVAGGILAYGTSYYGTSAGGTTAASNPFSSSSRFLNAGVGITYAQTRRLSYVFSGNYFLSNFSYGSSFSSQGVTGGASVLYRTTVRTTVGASYNHTYYTYTHSTVKTNVDGVALNVSHRFASHFQLDLSGGVNRINSSGTISIPVTLVFDGQTVTGYYVGPFSRTTNAPTFRGFLTYGTRHSGFSIGGGEGVSSGNGTYLTSRNQYGALTYSYSIPARRANISAGGTYSRLSSVANNVTQAYESYGASVGGGINLVRYVSANARYDYIHYAGLYVFSGLSESRISFGLSLSSKSVPLTLF